MENKECIHTLRTIDDFILNECVHFLADLQETVEKRQPDKIGSFDYMVADARDLANFFNVLSEDIKKLKKKRNESKCDCMSVL